MKIFCLVFLTALAVFQWSTQSVPPQSPTKISSNHHYDRIRSVVVGKSVRKQQKWHGYNYYHDRYAYMLNKASPKIASKDVTTIPTTSTITTTSETNSKTDQSPEQTTSVCDDVDESKNRKQSAKDSTEKMLPPKNRIMKNCSKYHNSCHRCLYAINDKNEQKPSHSITSSDQNQSSSLSSQEDGLVGDDEVSDGDCVYLICERRNFCIESDSPLLNLFEKSCDNSNNDGSTKHVGPNGKQQVDSKIHCKVWNKCPHVKRKSSLNSSSSSSSFSSSSYSSPWSSKNYFSNSFFSAHTDSSTNADNDKNYNNKRPPSKLYKHSFNNRFHNRNRGQKAFDTSKTDSKNGLIVYNHNDSNHNYDHNHKHNSKHNNNNNQVPKTMAAKDGYRSSSSGGDHFYRHFFTSATGDNYNYNHRNHDKNNNNNRNQHEEDGGGGFVQAIRQIGIVFGGGGHNGGSAEYGSYGKESLSAANARYHSLVYHISLGTVLALILCSFVVLTAVMVVAYKKIRKIYQNRNTYGSLKEDCIS